MRIQTQKQWDGSTTPNKRRKGPPSHIAERAIVEQNNRYAKEQAK